MQSVNNQKRLYWKLSGETGGNLKIAFNSFRLEKDLGNTILPILLWHSFSEKWSCLTIIYVQVNERYQ